MTKLHISPQEDRTFEHDLLDLYRDILHHGEDRGDRTGTGTRALFGKSLVIDLQQGFPLLTTKFVPFKSVLTELLWFIEGSGDERRLAELLHGTRDPQKKTIWSLNAQATTGSKFQPSYPGDLGRIYGVQWRHWQRRVTAPKLDKDGHTWYFPEEVDQLADVISRLKNNPTDRRIIMTAWNPGELDEMALPPCHMFVQFYLSNDRTLSAQMYQRSVDCFLGLPFNIASYALMLHMIAHVIDATVGKLHMVLGDTHLYRNHMEQVQQQLTRTPGSLPRLTINRQVRDIDDFKVEDFSLDEYQPLSAITAPMSA